MGTREEGGHPPRLEDIDFLANPNLKFIIFGGKGGSGKTTTAAATALYLSRVNPEKRILVMSTEPSRWINAKAKAIKALWLQQGGYPNKR